MATLLDPGSSEAEAIRQRYLKVDASTVADVLDTLGYFHQGLGPTFAPYPPAAGKLAGWAYTICGEMRPYSGSGDPDKMKAVDALKPGCVSVWSGSGEGVCFFGELIALGMKSRGVAGALVDGMAAASDGSLLFAQEQSNSIIRVWPDGRWWVEWPFVAGAGAVSFDAQGRAFAADRSCTDPGLGLGANCTIPSKIVQLAPERRTIADKFADGTTGSATVGAVTVIKKGAGK